MTDEAETCASCSREIVAPDRPGRNALGEPVCEECELVGVEDDYGIERRRFG